MKKVFRALFFLGIAIAAVAQGSTAWAEPEPSAQQVSAPTGKQLESKNKSDAACLQRYRQGLQGLLQFVASRPDLFPKEKRDDKRMLSEQDKTAVRSTWQGLLDYMLALESIKQPHTGFYKSGSKNEQRESFMVLYAAFLAQYRFALEFLATAENDPSLDVLLNDPVAEMVLQHDTYASFKFHFLNVAIASEFAAFTALNSYYGGSAPDMAAAIEEDKNFIWSKGKAKGETLTAKNARNIVKNAGFSAWMPVQQGVSEWMGDTKVWRKDVSLISQKQIREMLPKLEPGDMFFERHEWYLSNVGLPGFWSHAALFIGTPEERWKFFSGDEDLCRWIQEQGTPACDFEQLLKTKCPAAYDLGAQPQEAGHLPRVLEAISEGVTFTTMEHSGASDSLAVLRPRLSKKEKARAVLKAFQYSGRPYDFNFDFMTDASLVCSELVYKCYEPSSGFKGLTFPLQDMLGRKVTPPNEMVRQFDSQFGTPAQQSDFVLFYDGKELERTAVAASVDELRKSWTRPKWHVLTKEANQKAPQR